MFDSMGTIVATLLGAAGVIASAWLGRRAYTNIKADRDRIAANQTAIDAASKRMLEARRKADIHQAVLDAKRRDEFEKQP
jgi:uncharacterized membrane protein YebE (DUF533 family)